MPASVADFLQSAEASGILRADALEEYLHDVALETDATTLANRLVQDGRLTAFQAKHIYGGKAASLVLGPYVVLDMLGKGGMGHVYKAEHRAMHRVVALKVVARTALESPAAVRRFEREVQAATRLEHPNIVTAHDAGEAAGTRYLVMQFVDGPNLADVVRTLGPQPVGCVVDWILQAARGLAYAHAQGVIHRDIKPGNLLVDARGNVKVLDMGLARLESPEEGHDQLTQSGQIMGTVDYMAPEQAMDMRQADARSDIYALGATLWYLLTARPLFEADSTLKRIMAHQQTPAPRLTDAVAAADPRLDAVFQRMVAKQPAERFASMQEVVAALEALPQDRRAPGPPSSDFRGNPASLGPLDMAAPTHALRRMELDADDGNTPGIGGFDIDTDPALGPSGNLSRPAAPVTGDRARPRRHRIVISGGAIGLLLLGGVIAMSVGRRGGRASPEAPDGSPASAIAPFDARQARAHQAAWARHLGIAIETTNSLGATLVLIPPGRFAMGEGEGLRDVVMTEPFLIGQTEVTQRQWRDVMETEPWVGHRYAIAGDDVAATNVSWDDAVAFCGRLTERERASGAISGDQAYRLPTEAEWEYACRAGTLSHYSFGDDENMLGDYAWFGGGWDFGNVRPIQGGNTGAEPYAHAVGLKRPNAWQLFDMHGNVREWTGDSQADAKRGPKHDPASAAKGGLRVRRGGGWLDPAASCRSVAGVGIAPTYRINDLGFRVALNLPEPGAQPGLKPSAKPDSD